MMRQSWSQRASERNEKGEWTIWSVIGNHIYFFCPSHKIFYFFWPCNKSNIIK